MGISMLYISPLFPFILIGIDFFEYKFRHRRASESSSILFILVSYPESESQLILLCVCVMEARRTNTLWRPTLSDTHQTHFFILFSALCWAVVWCVCVMSLVVVVVVFVFFIIFTSLRVMLGLDHRLHFPPYRHHTLYRVSWRTDEPKEP